MMSGTGIDRLLVELYQYLPILVPIFLITLLMFEPVRFQIFHTWVTFPILGDIETRIFRMKRPSTEEANIRMQGLFIRYRKYIDRPLPKDDFDRNNDYLAIAGDASVYPLGSFSRFLLLVLLAAEAYSFSFLLGAALTSQFSEETAVVAGIVIAIVISVVVLVMSHAGAVAWKRTKAIEDASDDAVTGEGLKSGEKSVKDLTDPVRLTDDQDRDAGIHDDFGEQRLLNRVRRGPTDEGNYWPTVFFAALAITLALIQYVLRAADTDYLRKLREVAAGQNDLFAGIIPATDSPVDYGNLALAIFFVALQVFAFSVASRHAFIGQESASAYATTRGLKEYREFCCPHERRVRRADEGLSVLLTALRRYNVTPDTTLYSGREPDPDDGGASQSPPTTTADVPRPNVTPLHGANK